MKSIFLVSRRSLLPLTAFAPRVNSARSSLAIMKSNHAQRETARDPSNRAQPGTTGHNRAPQAPILLTNPC